MRSRGCMHTYRTCLTTCQSLVLISSKQNFCCPPLMTRRVQRAPATSALPLRTESHCTSSFREAAPTPDFRELLFSAASGGDEAVLSCNYISSGNGWTKHYVSKAICSFKVQLKCLCFEYERGLQRQVMVIASLPMSSSIHRSFQLAFTAAHFFPKNHPHVLTSLPKTQQNFRILTQTEEDNIGCTVFFLFPLLFPYVPCLLC